MESVYQHPVVLANGSEFQENLIGCNHRCLFCGYTWQRAHVGKSEFRYDGLWSKNEDTELAILDMHVGLAVNLNKLRTTAIDGMSERLRFAVQKKISKDMLIEFLARLAACEKPHQIKFYNIIGYPTETETDWLEFLENIKEADSRFTKQDKQTSILLHSTPFRAMPATPLACSPMSLKNYRGAVSQALGPRLKGNIFYQGAAMWAVESMATESLPTVI